MKKIAKQSLYTFVGALIILGITGGVILALSKTGLLSKDSRGTNVGKEEKNAEQKTTSTKSDFLHEPTFRGGNSGEYYYLKSFSFNKESDFDRIEIGFLPRSDSSGVPYFNLEQENSFLSITFSDTIDFDINEGKSTFEGEKQQAVEGWVAQEIAVVYPKDDSMVEIDIDCIGADFGYRIHEENLKLIIDLK